jgi:hypothetical protein
MKTNSKLALVAAITAVSGLAAQAQLLIQGDPSIGGGPPDIIIHSPNPSPGLGPVGGYEHGQEQKASHSAAPTGQAVTGNGIDYHGGPVMTGGVNIYYIWYGDWNGNTAVGILEDFANNIGGSSYYNINTTYSVPNTVAFKKSVNDPYSLGKRRVLSDSDIVRILNNNFSKLGGVWDPNGVYFVLTSADVKKSGFCTSYCGWHTYGTAGSTAVKYSFVGNPAQCINNCAAQSTGPNGNAGADGMVSIVAHELEEAATDPQLNAWYDSIGYENADKCAWTFGTTYTANGAKANMTLGTRDYLIQRNWVNANGGSCALSY